jgi:hypothetical protein
MARKKEKEKVFGKVVFFTTLDQDFGRTFYKKREEFKEENFFKVEYIPEFKGKTDVLKITSLPDGNRECVTFIDENAWYRYDHKKTEIYGYTVWREMVESNLEPFYRFLEDEMEIKLRNSFFKRNDVLRETVQKKMAEEAV